MKRLSPDQIRQLYDRERQKWLQTIDLESYGPEREFCVPTLLFRRIDGTEIVALQKRFEGL